MLDNALATAGLIEDQKDMIGRSYTLLEQRTKGLGGPASLVNWRHVPNEYKKRGPDSVLAPSRNQI
jgi:hypothetical protein